MEQIAHGREMVAAVEIVLIMALKMPFGAGDV